MTKLYIYTLKTLRKIYTIKVGTKTTNTICEQDPDKASQIIYNTLMADKPCMIARFGSTELATLINYLGIKYPDKNIWRYIQGKSTPWWWNDSIMNQMQQWSGFFPPSIDKIEQFSELMLQDIPQVDILGSWLVEEKKVEDYLNANKVHLRFLEPFWAEQPWTMALKGKKVLVVHPFSETIKKQYERKEFLFNNKDILPEFKSLNVIKAVQSLGKGDDRFIDWFEALEYMKSEIDKIDYEICLIGAGAYGFNLAAHVKKQGKKGIHLGGSLQLFFGIRGKRWEDPNYGVREWKIPSGYYTSMMNEHWVRPTEKEKPQNANKVENSCYW